MRDPAKDPGEEDEQQAWLEENPNWADDRPWGEQQPIVDWLETRYDYPPDPYDYEDDLLV